MKRTLHLKSLLLLVMSFAAFGCGEEASSPDSAASELLDIGPETEGLGKATFDANDSNVGKADSISGRKSLPVSVDNGPSAVWEIRNQWADTDTPDAKKAGMVWGENSGLNWDEKYSAWVQSMVQIDGESYFPTFELTTPYGKTLPSPALECAEMSMFLRASFASWYNLPFYVEAADADGRIFLGHFGFRRSNGRYANTPNFKTAYPDYSDRVDTWDRDGWPSDSRLRGRKLGGSQDDYQRFLGDDARAGTYFDEIYLNKRVGYFMVYLLSYFGSINLASSANMYHIDPKSVRAGDTLVKRYRRRGTGHVYVVKSVESLGGAYEVSVISGSMPRRQGKWESPAASKSAFTSSSAGGPGENSDGDKYAALGGGIRRFRVPTKVDGSWTNAVPAYDRENWINSQDHDAVTARIETWREILREVPVEEKRAVILQKISDARSHLSNYPASCAARERREDAFKELYDLEAEHADMSTLEVDAKYRTLEDYVFAKLVYDESKTCCWNSSTSAMYEIVMQKAMNDVEDHTAQQCATPVVFKARDGGYDLFKTYAESIGRGSEWVAWSEDESCSQRDVQNDAEAPLEGSSWCEIGHAVLNGGQLNNDEDIRGDLLELGENHEVEMCYGIGKEYSFQVNGSGNLTVTAEFNSFEGDIDLYLYDADRNKLDESETYSDSEKVSASVRRGIYVIELSAHDQEDCQNVTLRATLD
ncbi:MAG: hypothetical protein ACE366_01915 [Bradymonadia bacterium]